MLYTEFNVGEKVYKLRLNTRATVQLEEKLGCNPLKVFFDAEKELPKVKTLVTIFHAALQALQHNITLDDAYTIFDEWLDEGHVVTEFVPVVLEIYKESGLIARNNEKN